MSGVVVAASVLPANAAATTFTVSGFIDDGGDIGCSPSHACLTLRDAVNAASSGDVIRLGRGTYTLDSQHLGPRKKTGALLIGSFGVGKSLTIQGQGAGRTAIKQTDSVDPVVIAFGSSPQRTHVAFLSLAVTGGHDVVAGDPAYGGGIFADNMSLTLNRVTVARNAAISDKFGDGGGMMVGGNLTLIHSTISNNDASGGGGAAGGGILLLGGSGRIVDSTISGNRATGHTDDIGVAEGGGLAIAGASANITGSTFSLNRASPATAAPGDGGGIFLDQTGSAGKTVVFENSTITGNSVSNGGGGGIRIRKANGSAITLASVTIARNGASAGGNIRWDGSGSLLIGDSIIAKGTGSPSNCDMGGPLLSENFNLDDTRPSQCGFVNTDVLGRDPKLGRLRNNGGPTETMALLAGSPAIGHGAFGPFDSCGVVTVDQRGVPRAQPCDIGAYETGAPACRNLRARSSAGGVLVRLVCVGPRVGPYQISRGPRHGKVKLKSQTATYTPARGFHGIDRFTYRASAGTGGQWSRPATVTVTVG